MGLASDKSAPAKKPTIRSVSLMIMAGVRMRKGAEEWRKSRKIHERIVGKLEVMRRGAAKNKDKDAATNASGNEAPRDVNPNPKAFAGGKTEVRKSSLKSVVRQIIKEKDSMERITAS
jgi:hypothetical protein